MILEFRGVSNCLTIGLADIGLKINLLRESDWLICTT